MPQPQNVLIFAYSGAMQSAVLGLSDVLSVAGLVPVVVSDPMRTSAMGRAVILPPAAEALDPDQRPDLVEWLSRAANQGALICSACAGVAWVAAAGLDAGRAVTTHWGLEAKTRKDWPGLKLDVDRLVIEYSDLVTAGGMMAWIDLALIVVERLAGHQVMLETARYFVVDPDRRDQRRYQRFHMQTDHGDAQVVRAQQFIENNLQHGLTVAMLAAHAGLSPRSLQRRFAGATGLNLTRYLQKVRMERAKSILADSALSVAEIAVQSGYSDLPAFYRVFQKTVGMTPAGFRKTVRSHAGKGD